jgi:hypothetical protein
LIGIIFILILPFIKYNLSSYSWLRGLIMGYPQGSLNAGFAGVFMWNILIIELCIISAGKYELWQDILVPFQNIKLKKQERNF